MIIDLKSNTFFRGFALEVFAEKFLKKNNNNYFIIRTNRFAHLDALTSYYNLDLQLCRADLLKNYYKTIDIIEFVIPDYKTKIVSEVRVYEVKSKLASRDCSVDISIKAHQRYREMQESGISSSVVMIELLQDWTFSVELIPFLEFDNFCFRKQRYLFGNKTDVYTL